MPHGNIPMENLVSVDPRFTRSIHLERDYYAPQAADSYIVTRASRSALSLLSRGVAQPSCRAQCITGPYGTGKSALALFFAHMMAGDAGVSLLQRAVAEVGDEAQVLMSPPGQGYMTVLATGTRENIARCLVSGLRRSLQKSGRAKLLKKLTRDHPTAFESQKPSTRDVVALFESLAGASVQEEGALGVVVIIDELGKLLEHAAQYPEDGDIQILQELAEAASRSFEHPLWFVTILHRSFSEYAARVGQRHQQEWARVQGRFYDVPFKPDAVDTLQLVAGALNSGVNQIVKDNHIIRKMAEACAEYSPKIDKAVFTEQAISCYPLHPIALLNLQSMFTRLGQNERSLFSFLSADEPHSLVCWAHDRVFDQENPQFISLPELCDYAEHTLVAGAPMPTVAQAWAEVEEAIIRLGDADAEMQVLKSIALLAILSKTSGIHASREVLGISLHQHGIDEPNLKSALRSLEEQRFIVYSPYWQGYRLYEGGDLNIAECLAQVEETLGSQSFTLVAARDLCPSQPMVARRHSFDTGMMRSLSVVATDAERLLDAVIQRDGYDGTIVQCVVASREARNEVACVLEEIVDPAVIVGIVQENDELEKAARDITALHRVKTTYAEKLQGDRVAKRELSDRIMEAESVFRAEWNRVFGPGSSEAIWFWRGKEQQIRTSRDFAVLLSNACDTTYYLAPRVQNELINRRRLSSQAAAARRNLVEAMLTSAHVPGLGFEGYPPERSIYESILLRTGMHRPQVTQEPNGVWCISAPDDTDAGLHAAWTHIKPSISSDDLDRKTVADLFGELTSSPYGVADGLVPVLLTAYLIVNDRDTVLYEGSTFVPELTAPVMERLMRRPETFSILSYSITGERAAVVSRFARGFRVEEGVMPVVRDLYVRMNSLPDYVRRTSNLTPEAIAVRNAIDMAKSPERLLFDALPQAVGCRSFTAEDAEASENVERFFEGLNKAFASMLKCYPKLIDSIRASMLSIFDLSDAQESWRDAVADRAERLLRITTDSNMCAFARRVASHELPDREYVESVGAVIAESPPSRWRKADEDTFGQHVVEFASAVRAAESLSNIQDELSEGEDGYMLSIDSPTGVQVRRLLRFTGQERELITSMADELLSGANGHKGNTRLVLAALVEAARKLIADEA